MAKYTISVRAEGKGLPTVDVSKEVEASAISDALDNFEEILADDVTPGEWKDIDDAEERATLVRFEIRKTGDSPRKRPKRRG